MARKSRTQAQLMKLHPQSVETKIDETLPVFKTAIYIRLSNNNFATTNVDVLQSQINHLQEYVASHADMELVDTYIDDGWSGMNFNRPAFARMMEDMKAEKINCIVVRDFSRFGRNYLETGYYLQKIFPAYNVRFIAVFDEFDSLVSDSDSMIVSMVQLMNDFYCKDISKKICSAYDSKVPKGFCWGKAPYGYYRRDDNSGKLLMDGRVSYIAYLIFYWAYQKKSPFEIARNLNLLGFRYTPSESNSISSEKQTEPTEWNAGTIRGIIKNPLYTGDFVYNRHRNRKYDASHIGALPMERWKYVSRTHPAYIIKSEYLQLQNYFAEKSEHFQATKTQNAKIRNNSYNPFHQLLYCGECGHCMSTIKKDNVCVTDYRCKGHFLVQAAGHLAYTIERSVLMHDVQKQLIIQKKEACDLLSALSSMSVTTVIEQLTAKKSAEISLLNSKIIEIEEKLQRAEKDYRKGLLDDETHTLQIEKLKMEQSIIQDDIAFLNDQLSELHLCFSEENPWLTAFRSLEISDEIPSSVLHQLISRIEVFSDQHVVISYHLTEYKQKLIGYINEWEHIKHEEVHTNGE